LTGHGIGAAWQFPPYVFARWQELVQAGLLGVAIGLCAVPFVWGLHAVKRLFAAMRVPMVVKAALGGLVLGLVAWQLPGTRYFGEAELQTTLLDASPAVSMLLLLAVAKMLTICVTLASGWRGGIIIPCFFVGACLGKAAALLIPGLDPPGWRRSTCR